MLTDFDRTLRADLHMHNSEQH